MFTKNVFFWPVIWGLALTSMSYAVGFYLGWIATVSLLEVFAVFTSYVCTIMCVHQTRWNYPVGIVTTAAYSILFFSWSMPALAIFNLYLVGSLIYGWFRWGSDSNTRPVTKIEPKWYLGYGLFGVLVLVMYLLILNIFGVPLNFIDIGLAVFSGIAQLMLDNKKLETWIVWAGVDIVSIPFFWVSGGFLVAFQYVFFLANTIYGYISWKRSMK